MSRNARQTQILGIIAQKDIETQEELVAELKLLGFAVTQATISRDIKELNLGDSPNLEYLYYGEGIELIKLNVECKTIRLQEKRKFLLP